MSLVTHKIMMVCLGNICRSPMAAAVLDNRARQAVLEMIEKSVHGLLATL